MKRINPLTSTAPASAKTEPNVLKDIHLTLGSAMVIFRALVCVECNWSLPTYYRKISKGGISNAEKDACNKTLAITVRFVTGNLDNDEQEMITNIQELLVIEQQKQAELNA